MINAVLQEATTYHRREQLSYHSLNTMVDGLGWGAAGDNYGAARGREEEQDEERARLGMVALEEPLKPDKLCYVLTVGIGPQPPSIR